MSFHPTTVSIGDTTYLPVPDDVTLADAVAALADAGTWVEFTPGTDPMTEGARIRETRQWAVNGGRRFYVHRDDLPPTDPDAELVEKMAAAMYEDRNPTRLWTHSTDTESQTAYRTEARAALAVVREHEATR